MAKVNLTKSAILKVISEQKPQSFSGLYRILGGRSSPASSTIKSIRKAVPDIDKRLKANKGKGVVRPSGKSRRKKWPRSKSNPFRENSSYGLAYDILAAHPEGLSKEKWLELYSKSSGKDPKTTARYDLAVLLTAKDSPTSERHRSCRENFWIERENQFCRLRTK